MYVCMYVIIAVYFYLCLFVLMDDCAYILWCATSTRVNLQIFSMILQALPN